MANKKYTVMLGLLGLISTASFAQEVTTVETTTTTTTTTPVNLHKTYVGTDADNAWVYNSEMVKNADQQNRFVTDAYPYPAKPRNMWELSLGVGPTFMISSVDPKLGYGATLSLRKALGHVFSIRPQYGYHIAYGQDYRFRPASHAVQSVRTALAGQDYLANYKMVLHQGSLDLIASLNAISGYRGNAKVDWYALVGYSFNAAQVGVNANGSTRTALAGLPEGGSRSDIRKFVNDKFETEDNSFFTVKDNKRYETMVSERNGRRDDAVGSEDYIVRHGLNYGMGVAFKVSPRFNIGVEQKFTSFLGNSDVMSGLVLQPQGRNSVLSSTQLKFNFNLGSSARAIEPLWWVNPNNYVYSELKSTKPLPDADGDGVTDQFDLEPNTPAGCAVDTRGRSLDTDGDGVPDCRDKQVVTPNTWFPVDADGVGTDPCCNQAPVVVAADCAITSLPSVTFSGSSVNLSSGAESALANAASQLNANPNCKVKVVAYGSSNKRAQQLSWDRANVVRNYLVERQGISESRIIFQYGNDGNANAVDLYPTTEEGPSTVPAPFPHLQKS